MVARGALWNASIFCPKGKLPWEDVKREYVRKVSVSQCCGLSVVHDGISQWSFSLVNGFLCGSTQRTERNKRVLEDYELGMKFSSGKPFGLLFLTFYRVQTNSFLQHLVGLGLLGGVIFYYCFWLKRVLLSFAFVFGRLLDHIFFFFFSCSLWCNQSVSCYD